MKKNIIFALTAMCFLIGLTFYCDADAFAAKSSTSTVSTAAPETTESPSKSNIKAKTVTKDKKASKKIKVNITKCTLVKNTSYTIRVYNVKKSQSVTFKSDKNAIVSTKKTKVNQKSVTIKARRVGTANIKTNVYNKKGNLVRSLKTSVKVTPKAISVKFTKNALRLKVGESKTLSTIVKPSSSSEIPVFESSDSDIITVNAKGVITAMSEGSAYVSATILSNKQTVTCHITVSENNQDEENE